MKYACHLCGHELIAPWQRCPDCGAGMTDHWEYQAVGQARACSCDIGHHHAAADAGIIDD
jgi:primosomal protein N'